jgi:hypothetical protein
MHHNHNDAAIQTAPSSNFEHLTRAHQVLSSQGATFPEELREPERSILLYWGIISF